MRARPSQSRQNRMVDAIRASASSTSCGVARPSAQTQRAERALPCPERVTAARAARFDPEREVAREADRQAPARRVRQVAAPVDERPLRRSAAVVEHRLADELDLDVALDALDGAHEQVLGVVVRRRTRVRRDRVLLVPRAESQRIPHDDPARGHLPGRDEHVRSGLVRAGGRVVDAERPEPEHTGLAVEQAPEHARGVEPGHAQPVDAAVVGDEGTRMAVREEAVVGDRRERRGACARHDAVDRCRAHDTIHGSCQRL